MARKVLLIEDNKGDADLVRIMLRKSAGTYEVDHKTSVRGGLLALRNQDYDVLLLDLSLPDAERLSGLELIQLQSDIPVIVMSGTLDEKVATDAVAKGAQDYLTKGHVDSHFLHRAIGYALERKAAKEKLAYLARYDAVTGLPNRSTFFDRLTRSLKRAQRTPPTHPVVFILDLDRFKSVNDTHGHGVGDALLLAVSQRIQESVRDIDTVARIGGDEFAILFENTEGDESIATAAERIVAALTKSFMIEGHKVHTGSSVGIAFPTESFRVDEIMRNADLAMYRAKQGGGSAFCFYDQEMHARAQKHQRLSVDIYEALERDQLILFYQSINDTTTGSPVAFEALLRWHHPDFGLVRPDEFIPILEKTGLIVPVGRWVLRNACEQLAKWQEEFDPELRVSVNASARQFEDSNLLDAVRSVIKDTGIAARHLEVEVTESLLVKNMKLTQRVLTALREQGVRVGIDDFGTGYSQLVYLVRFPITTLKIDKSVIDTLGSVEGDKLVKAVIDLGHSLGFDIVGEGVEEVDQLKLLRAKNCDTFQGYYASRPQNAADTTMWLRSLEE